MTRKPLLLTAAALALGGLVIGGYLFQPWRVATTRTVSEALPTRAAEQAPTQEPAQEPTRPPADPVELGRGSFVSQAHETTGTARVLELADGSRVLRLEGLATSDGPDLKVWLTDAPATADAGDRVDDGTWVNLGDLKGNRGDQNYDIPADADLDTLTSVSVWCDRFNVSFGVAALA
jgi:hypothetical protein